MTELTDHKKEALGWLEANRAPLNELCETIWASAETAWREYESAEALAGFLAAKQYAPVVDAVNKSAIVSDTGLSR